MIIYHLMAALIAGDRSVVMTVMFNLSTSRSRRTFSAKHSKKINKNMLKKILWTTIRA
jgi:hypothetical protein